MKLLRCMIYRQGGMYVAACLDLSLAAQGGSIEEVRKKLSDQISDYVKEAYAEPEYTDSLMNRTAPLSMWAKYYWLRFLSALHGQRQTPSKRQPVGPVVFEERCLQSA